MANAGAQIHFWGQSGEKSELSLEKAVMILKEGKMAVYTNGQKRVNFYKQSVFV